MSRAHDLSRRQLLKAAAAAAVAWRAAPWPVRAPRAFAQTPPSDPETVATLEAFADTLIPGPKRSPTDRAIAGASPTPGAVQAGALDLMNLPAAGAAAALPGVAAGLNTHATQFALANAIVLDPTVPPFVSLDFAQRTTLLVQVLDENPSAEEQLAYFAIAALAFLAYHTAGHLHLADAVRGGHPGLAAIGFPEPDADDLWRYPEFSYRRALGVRHPGTRKGSPG